MIEWFFENVFKIIYLPIFYMIVLANMVLIAYMVSDLGLRQPYTWLIIIGFIAYIAEKTVAK